MATETPASIAAALESLISHIRGAVAALATAPPAVMGSYDENARTEAMRSVLTRALSSQELYQGPGWKQGDTGK